MLLHVRLDFYGQYVVDADAKVVQSVDVFPTELNYLCATFFDHRGYGMLFVLFKYGDMFTLGLVKDENPVI